MRTFVWMGTLLVLLVLQATLIPLIGVQGTRPDLLLIMTVSGGLLFGKEQGIGIGFFAGLAQDLASGNIFGVNTLSKMATGFATGLAEKKVFKENILLPILSVAIATVVNGAVTLMLLVVLGYKVSVATAFSHSIFPQMGYNLVFAIPVHRLIVRLSRNSNFPHA